MEQTELVKELAAILHDGHKLVLDEMPAIAQQIIAHGVIVDCAKLIAFTAVIIAAWQFKLYMHQRIMDDETMTEHDRDMVYTPFAMLVVAVIMVTTIIMYATLMDLLSIYTEPTVYIMHELRHMI